MVVITGWGRKGVDQHDDIYIQRTERVEGCAVGIAIQQIIDWRGSMRQGHQAEQCIDDDEAQILILTSHSIKGLSSNGTCMQGHTVSEGQEDFSILATK